MLKTLRSQLYISMLLVLLVTIVLVSALGSWIINREFERYLARHEEKRSENIVNDLGTQYNGMTRTWNLDFLHTIGMYSLYDGYILRIYDADGNELWDAEEHDMTLCGQIMEDILRRMESVKVTGGFSAHDYGIHQGGRKIGTVSITYYGPYFLGENDFQFIKALNSGLIVTGIVAALFSIIIGSLLARRIAHTVSKTADIADQISMGNYDIRFEGETNMRELNALVSAINHLAGALAEQENRRKRLTTDIAHELRTPLTAVSFHLEAMISGLWEPTIERLQACHDVIQRLGRLVIDLQHLARIEDKHITIKKTWIDLMDVTRLVVETMAAEAKKKNLSLMVEGSSSFVQADKERMLQVVTNLLSNAIKYTPEGGHIQIEVIDSSESSTIKVNDDGIGIPEQELPLIFERFYRTDKSRNRKTGGTGIGLTIVKSIVSAHSGIITVDSHVDQGSSFIISIPKRSRDE